MYFLLPGGGHGISGDAGAGGPEAAKYPRGAAEPGVSCGGAEEHRYGEGGGLFQ